MNRRISEAQMAGTNLIKNLQLFIFVRIPQEALPTNGKLKFDNNNCWKSNYIDSSGNNHYNDNNNSNNNNEYKCSYNDNNDDDDEKNDSNNNTVDSNNKDF